MVLSTIVEDRSNNSMKTIPIFYACDDAFIKYTIVSLTSMIENASSEYFYDVHVLSTTASEKMKKKTLALANNNFSITFDDVSAHLDAIQDKLPIRDYYSKTTYFRLFIAEMFPLIDKAIYIDSDTLVCGDVSRLYEHELGNNLLGAAHEQAMVQIDEYGTYVEQNLGIDRNNYFNAGVLLINCDKFRREGVLSQFVELLGAYNFRVTQDEDYLNVICKDRVLFVDQRWNTEMIGEIPYPSEEYNIIHYIMVSKPWHYRDCRCGDIFWKYASKTEVYGDILAELDSYTDEKREKDAISAENLLKLAIEETYRDNKYVDIVKKNNCSPDRRAVLEKIERLEKSGIFDRDVENDPPSRTIMPGEVDYCQKRLSSKIWSKIAYKRAEKYLKSIIASGDMVIKEIRGEENIKALDSGAIITCNHFNAHDSFAIQLAYEAANNKKRKLYRVIREGNYTSFPGFFGFLMRHCNTLPLSSNRHAMAEMSGAVDHLLKKGHFVLVYPEQSMWWNYRKPKPLKDGGFYMAAKAVVPVLPVFITMEDTNKIGGDGYPVQAYTIHILPAIYPKADKSVRENVSYMKYENSRLWRDCYESFYKIKLRYTTEDRA